jgi:hypothetical protein
MRNAFLMTVVACLLGAGAMRAIPILGPPVTPCSAISGVGGSPNDLTFSFAIWSSANFACEQQDKIYSNFSVGAIPTDTTLRIQLQPLGTVDFHTVTVDGNFGSSFTFSYDIAVDLTVNPLIRITAVTGDISNPSNTGAPANTKTVFTEGGTMLGTLTSTATNPGTPINLTQTALHVTDAYVANGGAAVSISNTFREDLMAGAPEPVSYLLVGTGVLLVAGLRRTRRS